jgi:hypothetical protein
VTEKIFLCRIESTTRGDGAMLKYLLIATVAAGAIMAAIGSGDAADKKYTFALVPKNTNNPFFDQAPAGRRRKRNSRAPSSASISGLANTAAVTRRPRSLLTWSRSGSMA